MISIVIGNQENFPEDRITLRVGDRTEEVGFGILNDILRSLEVRRNAPDRLFPEVRRCHFIGAWPVPIGERR